MHYAGWKLEDTVPPEFRGRSNELSREHASPYDLIPEKRKGCLDQGVLTRLGLTEKRMKGLDALFFFSYSFPFATHLNLEYPMIHAVVTMMRMPNLPIYIHIRLKGTLVLTVILFYLLIRKN